MLLHDSIVAAYSEGFSGVYVKCNAAHATAVEFMSKFIAACEQAMDDAEESYGVPCMEKDLDSGSLASILPIDEHQFCIRLAPLFLSMNDGVRADNQYLPHALESVLRQLKQAQPDLEYWGMISYEWYDEHCGDVNSYEIGSSPFPNAQQYPFVTDIFSEIWQDESLAEEFWEKFEDNIADCDEETASEVVKCFEYYKQSKEVIARVKELLAECIEE